MKIVESYQIPQGNVSPDIFALPCVSSAYKTMTHGIRYHVEHLIAQPTDWICKRSNGEWIVLTEEEYRKTNKPKEYKPKEYKPTRGC